MNILSNCLIGSHCFLICSSNLNSYLTKRCERQHMGKSCKCVFIENHEFKYFRHFQHISTSKTSGSKGRWTFYTVFYFYVIEFLSNDKFNHRFTWYSQYWDHTKYMNHINFYFCFSEFLFRPESHKLLYVVCTRARVDIHDSTDR